MRYIPQVSRGSGESSLVLSPSVYFQLKAVLEGASALSNT